MKFISIIGSVSENRTYDPPLRNSVEAHATAEALGAELARRGYGLTVYAGDFIECDVVRGYVTKATKPHSIRVLFASRQKGATGFPEYVQHCDLFDPLVDTSPDWEMSFYGSLARTDGIVIIGGGHASLVIGILALVYRIPVIALRAFGGSGEKIWSSLSNGRGLATPDEVADMGKDRDGELLGRWIDSLGRQAGARRRELNRLSGNSWLMVAIVLVVAWVLTLPIGYWLLALKAGSTSAPWFIGLLFVAPILSGASGATVRMFLPDAGTPTMKSTFLGMAAGAISGVLYVASQLTTNSDPSQLLVLVTAVAFGFVAGLTFDAVFKKIERQDAAPTESLTKATP